MKNINTIPLIIISTTLFAYFAPLLFSITIVLALIVLLGFIGYLKTKFWYIVAKKVLDYKD